MRWSDPIDLEKYKQAVPGPGLYVVGKAQVKGASLQGNGQSDSYFLENWPNAMLALYVGISLSQRSGMRARLSAHARGRGNKFLKKELNNKEQLYFIQISGLEATEYEALFIALKKKLQFEGNVRDEADRVAKRRFKVVRAAMTEFERDHYDNMDPRDG